MSDYQTRGGTGRSGPVQSRQSFSLSDDEGTELRRDGDVPVSVNVSRLITHDKMLLNGDVPRRKGNVTDSVNRSSLG